jgi:hypothetical protein
VPSTRRAAHRRSDWTASAAVTGEPSWNFWPARSLNVQVMPSALVEKLSTICGFGCILLSSAKSVS